EWGDGQSEVTSPTASGTTLAVAHPWTAAGSYDLRAMAEDVSGGASGWSATLRVVISDAGGGNASNGTDTWAPVIVHAPPPPTEAGEDVRLVATVTDDGGVENVVLRYRLPGASGFVSIAMRSGSPSSLFEATVATVPEKKGRLDYYIEATDSAGNLNRSPPGAPADVHTVVVGSSGQVPPPQPASPMSLDPMLLISIAGVVAGLAVAIGGGAAVAKRARRCPACRGRHGRNDGCSGWSGWN
ncbi:MAG TPA: hypothetical protein VI893_09880, partial [Thermoplasmata archaeon]|nr:hypothetical protein [Thermoplasmata archaeon]